jgi:hypothetical protein
MAAAIGVTDWDQYTKAAQARPHPALTGPAWLSVSHCTRRPKLRQADAPIKAIQPAPISIAP